MKIRILIAGLSLIIALIVCAKFYLSFHPQGDARLTNVEVSALYSISELGEPELNFYDMEIVGEHHVSLTLFHERHIGYAEVKEFLNLSKEHLNQFEEIDLYFHCRGIEKRIFQELKKITSIKMLYVLEVDEDETKKYVDEVCKEMNWKMGTTRIKGDKIFLYPHFRTHPTTESWRREQLGWLGRLKEDIGCN